MEANRRIQRCKAELMQVIEEMNEWGGEHSFIAETRDCCSRIHEHLKDDNEFLLDRIELELPPASYFKIFIQSMNVWAN
jgi:hypothetical protein